jgi:hypothetical protein
MGTRYDDGLLDHDGLGLHQFKAVISDIRYIRCLVKDMLSLIDVESAFLLRGSTLTASCFEYPRLRGR